MQSVSGIYFAQSVATIPAVYQPRELPVIGSSVTFEDLSSGKWRTAFLVPQCLKFKQMKRNAKRQQGETANTITFMADWLDFTDHLTNAQFGRLARCVARFERGDISTAHVDELRKDAAVGVAYNFITDQISRRAQQ
jgi:hypothetical protein